MSGPGNSSTFSFGKKGSKFLRGIKRILAPRYIQTTVQSTFNAALGRQGTFVPRLMGNKSPNTDLITSDYLFSQEDFDWIRAGALADISSPASAGLSSAAMRLIVDSVQTRLTLKNQTTFPVELWIYDLVARRDDRENRDLDRDTLQDTDPLNTWEQGLRQETVTGGVPNGTNVGTFANPQRELPGITPFKSERFCHWWHARRVRRINLQPGDHHIHTVKWHGPRVFNMALMGDLNLLRKTTYACLLVLKGPLVRDTSTPFRMSIGSAEIDCIAETSYKYQCAVSARTGYNYYTDLAEAMTVQAAVSTDYNIVTANDTVV